MSFILRKLKLVLLLLLPLPLLTQETEPSKWAFGVSFAPFYSDQILINNLGTSDLDEIVKFRNQDELPLPGFQIGFQTSYALNAKTELSAGVKYTRRGVKIKWQENDPLLAPGVVSILRGRFKYYVQYLDLPFEIRFRSGGRSTQWITGIGIQPSIFINAQQDLEAHLTDGRIIRNVSANPTPYNALMISGRVKSGIQFGLSHRANMEVLPFFEYGFNQAISTDIGQRWYGGGLECNFNFTGK